MTTTWSKQTGTVGGVKNFVPRTKITRAQVNGAPIEVLETVLVGVRSYTETYAPGRYLIRTYLLDPIATGRGQNVQTIKVAGDLYHENVDCFLTTGQQAGEVVRDVIYQHPGGPMPVGYDATVGTTTVAGTQVFPGGNLPLSHPIVNTAAVAIPTDGTWRMSLWPNRDQTGPPPIQQLDTSNAPWKIDKVWGLEAPAANFPADGWSGRWEQWVPGLVASDLLIGSWPFNGADGTVPPAGSTAPWQIHIESGGAVRGSYGRIQGNSLDLFEIGAVGRDGFVRATIYPADMPVGATADIALEGEVLLTTLSCHGPSMWARNQGDFPGPHTGVMMGLTPTGAGLGSGPVNQIMLAKRNGADTSSDPAGAFTVLAVTPKTVPANVWMPFWFESEGDQLRCYIGTTAGAFFVPGVTPWSLTAGGATPITAAGGIELFNGDHGYAATSHVQYRNVKIRNLAHSYVGTLRVDDGGRPNLDGVKLATYLNGQPADAWIQQAPTTYTAPFSVAGPGAGPAGQHLVTVDFFEAFATGELHWSYAEAGAPVVPPVTSGEMKQGFFKYNGVEQVKAFSQSVGVDANAWHVSLDSGDIQPLWTYDGAVAWLNEAGHSDRVLMENWNWLVGRGGAPGAGAWDDTTTDAQATAHADYIVSLGVASKVIVRLGYECNAWWFPWGSTQPGNIDGAGFKRLFRRIAPIFRSRGIRVTWGVVPGQPGQNGPAAYPNAADATIFWPGSDVVDFIDFDIYDWALYGSGSRINQQRALPQGLDWLKGFSDAQGIPFLIGETGLALGNDGAGDDPQWITDFYTWCANNGCYAVFYEDVPDGNVNTTLEENPNGWLTYRQWWQAYAAAHP